MDHGVLSAETRREMHKARYLGNTGWSEAFGISWYSIRKDDVVWVQHSGGIHGFVSNACFDPTSRVGAVVLVNGSTDASALAMSLGSQARTLVEAVVADVEPVPTPPELAPLLGIYALPNLGYVLRIEWRDGKLMIVDTTDPITIELIRSAGGDEFVVAPGFRQSGEQVSFRRLSDGRVSSMIMKDGSWVRLEPAV
jgi:hypothetical protein